VRRGKETAFPLDRLPRVARGASRLTSLMGARVNAASLAGVAGNLAPALGDAVRVRCLALDAGASWASRPAPLPVVVAVSRVDHGRAWALLDAALAVDLVSRLLRIEEIGAPREITPTERGLIGYLALLALRTAPGWRLDSVEISPFDAPADAVAAELDVVLGSGARYGARVVVDAPTLLRLPPSAPRWEHASRLARVVLEAPIVLATARLPAAEIRSLRPGDVVVLDPSPTGELRVGAGGFPLEIGPEQLRVTGPYQDRTERSGENMEAKQDLLQRMAVEIAAEIGRLRLTGKELLDLEPGAVLPFGRPTAGPVDLTCDGRIVARGELVDIEGEMGVRLTEVLP